MKNPAARSPYRWLIPLVFVIPVYTWCWEEPGAVGGSQKLEFLTGLSKMINGHLFDGSPGRLVVSRNGREQYQLSVTGVLILDTPLELRPEEVVALKENMDQQIRPATHLVLNLSDWRLANFHQNDSGFIPCPPGREPEREEKQSLADNSLMFSARPGFEEPYLIHVTGEVKDVSHLTVNVKNLPPTSTGCYLSGIVLTTGKADTEVLASLAENGSLKPSCTVNGYSGLLSNSSVPVVETPGRGGRRPSRRQIQNSSQQKQPPPQDEASAPDPLPPPPPSGGSGSGGAG